MSDANLTLLSYALEGAFAETPDLASTLQNLRFTGESLDHRKDTVVSEEIRADRVRADLIQVGQGAEGSVETEMIIGAYNDWILAALLASAWSEAADAVTATAAAAGNTITATVGTFSATTQGAKYVHVSGLANADSNGIKRVVSCTSTVLTVAPVVTGGNAIEADEAGASVTVTSRYARNGITFQSFLLEKHFTGPATPRFDAMIGAAINEWSLTMEAQARILASWGFLGAKMLDSTATHGDGTNTAASTRDIVNSTSNIGQILLDGSALTVNAMAFNMTLNNNLRERPALSRLFTLQHGKGTIDLTGSFEAYFEDAQLLTKYLNHVAAALLVPLIDGDGNLMSIHLPKIHITDDGTPKADAINTDIILTNNFQAVVDPTLGYVIQIDQLDADEDAS